MPMSGLRGFVNGNIFDLTGKVALVTGASSGFGQYFAKVLAANGAKVVLCARRVQRLEELVGEIEGSGGNAIAVGMDATNPNSVASAFQKAEAHFGTVTVVSNNAGVADPKKAIEINESSWDYVLDTNLKGAWLVAHEAGTRMIAAGVGGTIVNTASILGLRVAMNQASYSASKAAVIQLTKALALEWSRKDIRVNALCPGYFVTEMNAAYFQTDQGKHYIHQTPAQRTGELEEITAPFLLLVSSAGSFINGIALPVDGAHSLSNM